MALLLHCVISALRFAYLLPIPLTTLFLLFVQKDDLSYDSNFSFGVAASLSCFFKPELHRAVR